MYKSASASTVQTILGKFFVETFQDDPKKKFTSQEIREAIKDLGITSLNRNIATIIERDFTGAIVYIKDEEGEGFGLNSGWGDVNDLREAVNDHRRRKGFEELKAPKQEGGSSERRYN